MSNFIKRKLSREALDAFALKYTNESHSNVPNQILYALANGRIINFLPGTAGVYGTSEFFYLIGQTFPFHDRKQVSYPITDLAFIKTKDGKKVPWTQNPKDVTALITLGVSSHSITVEKRK